MKRMLALLLALLCCWSMAGAEDEPEISPYVTAAQLELYEFENYHFDILLPDAESWTYEETDASLGEMDGVEATVENTASAGVEIHLRMMNTGDETSDFSDDTFFDTMMDYYTEAGVDKISREVYGENQIVFLRYRRVDTKEIKWQYYETVHRGISVRLRYPVSIENGEEAAAVCKAMRDSLTWVDADEQPEP